MNKIIVLLIFIFPVMCFGAILEITSLDDSKAERREKTFEDWIPLAESQARFDELTGEKNMLPIYSERLAGDVRDLYVKKPDGCVFWSFGGMSKSLLIKRHKKHTSEGFVILSISKFKAMTGDVEYWATWVDRKSLKKVKRELRRFGLSEAKVIIEE